jgi:hypothetical protein
MTTDIIDGSLKIDSNSEYRSIPGFEDWVKGAGVQISLPSEELSLVVKGTVVWSRLVNMERETTMALGLRFQKMSPRAQGILLGFANNLDKFDKLNQSQR